MSAATKLQAGNDYAWVSCDGKPLPVYGVETSGNKTTAWMPSEAGKAFTVTIRCRDVENDISARVFVDGMKVDSRLIRKHKTSSRVIEGARASATAIRPMHFAVIKTSDDESHCMAATALSKLGTIHVEFYRVQVLGPSATSDNNFAKSLDQTVAVHEKQKKLGGHHTTLGAPQALAKPKHNVKTINLDSDPRTVLEFKYRPKDILQAQDIIPVVRAPSPAVQSSSRSNKRPLEDTGNAGTSQRKKPSQKQPTKRVKQEDPDHTRRLEEYIRQLQSQLPGDHPLLDNAPIVKPEPIEIKAHKFFKKGEIIDLTDD